MCNSFNKGYQNCLVKAVWYWYWEVVNPKHEEKADDVDDVDDQNGADCLGKLHEADRSLEIKSRLEVKNAAKLSTDEKGG